MVAKILKWVLELLHHLHKKWIKRKWISRCIIVGHTQHTFADSSAADIGFADKGRIYDSVASERYWIRAMQFFQEVFTA